MNSKHIHVVTSYLSPSLSLSHHITCFSLIRPCCSYHVGGFPSAWQIPLPSGLSDHHFSWDFLLDLIFLPLLSFFILGNSGFILIVSICCDYLFTELYLFQLTKDSKKHITEHETQTTYGNLEKVDHINNWVNINYHNHSTPIGLTKKI